MFYLLVAFVMLIAGCRKEQPVLMNQEDNEVISESELFEPELTEIELFETTTLYEHDFILYYVNCAADNIIETEESHNPGLYQSIADKEYGRDDVTGMVWGYQKKEYMIPEYDSKNVNDSKWTIAEGIEYVPEETGFYYDFSLPEGEYEITVGFFNPFSARTIDVDAEGMNEISGQKILKYNLTEAVFTKNVTDGELNLKIYNSKRGKDYMKNPILSYIMVSAVPEYDKELLFLLLSDAEVKAEKEEIYTRLSFSKLLKKKTIAEAVYQSEAAFDDIKEAYLALEEAYKELSLVEIYDSFRPGDPWYDTDNNLIQAHGGQVQKLMIPNETTGILEEKWWWVGEDKTKGNRGGICAYSSFDLYNWTFEGIIMRNISQREQLDTEEYFIKLYNNYSEEELDNVYQCINDSTSIIERPKMIYNEVTGKYVLWFHADGPTDMSDSNYAAASAGVAISDSPAGPFQFIDRYRLHTCPEDQEDMYPQSKGMARDMNLFVDDDKTAYIIYSSEENLTIYISKLNESYTYLETSPDEAVYGVDYIRLYPGAQREAPAIVKKVGWYYLMTSGATGWSPNQARYWRASELFGEWTDMGDPCIGDINKTTFESQSTCIFNAGGDAYIYMGDRWNSEELAESRYVWLPINFNKNGELEIRWIDKWRYEAAN